MGLAACFLPEKQIFAFVLKPGQYPWLPRDHKKDNHEAAEGVRCRSDLVKSLGFLPGIPAVAQVLSLA